MRFYTFGFYTNLTQLKYMWPINVLERKIISWEDLDSFLACKRFKDARIVFTNGCFDIIHRGHIDYLSKASALGDLLIIGLNTDESVRKLKGPERPLQDEKSRAMILAALFFVDNIILFSEDTPYLLIDKIRPQVLVKGGDYKPEDIVGYDIVKESGGKVVTIDFVEGYSSTGIIEKL